MENLKTSFINVISSLHRHVATDSDNINLYLNLISLRHDIIHAFLCESIGVPFNPGITKNFTSYFDADHVVSKTLLTPDIVFVQEGEVTIIDVSVSKDSTQQIDKKIKKYNACFECIDQKKYKKEKQKIFIFSISPSYNNLEARVNELSHTVPLTRDFNYADCIMCLEMCDAARNEIRSNFKDKLSLDKILSIEFGSGDEDSSLPKNRLLTNIHDNLIKKNKDFHRNIPNLGLDELAEQLGDLLCDTDIKALYSDKPITESSFMDAYNEVSVINKRLPKVDPKPSLHMYFPREDVTPNMYFPDMDKEQIKILSVLKQIIRPAIQDSHPFAYEISKTIYDLILFEESELQRLNTQMFNSNKYFEEKLESELRSDYSSYRGKMAEEHTPCMSFVDFLNRKKKINLDPTAPHFVKQKIIKIQKEYFTKEALSFLEKANNETSKRGEIVLDSTISTVDMSLSRDMDDFLSKLSSPCIGDELVHLDNVITQPPGIDHPNVEVLKHLMHDRVLDRAEEIEDTYAHTFAQQYSRVAEQLLHFSNFSLSKNTFSVFNADVPNAVFIVANSHHNSGKDVGKAFLSMGLVSKKEKISTLFGDVKRIQCDSKEFDIFVTNWRRLTCDKLHFIRESYFQTLSTGLNSMLRRKDSKSDKMLYNEIKHNYSLRVLVSMSTKQRVAEMLADFRYLIMHSTSDFGSVSDFIKDKLAPAYHTVIEVWIASRIPRLAHIHRMFTSGKLVALRQPTFFNIQRANESLGGDLKIPSPWTNFTHYDIQDFLDDLFLYVHTPKEPSSIHHENIKSINTILKFQNMYDSLTPSQKDGDWLDMKHYLLNSPLTGHFNSVTKLASEVLVSGINKESIHKGLQQGVLESVSELTSTKSVIPEYDRKVEKFPAKTKKRQNKEKNAIEKLTADITKNWNFNINDQVKIVLEEDAKIVKLSSSRMKVHDAVLDMLDKNPNLTTTLDLACWNIVENNSKVVSDICIKAQYGSKREFYVINLGAKAMVRIFENVFKSICHCVKSEMISIPGDRKMNIMQEITNSVVKKKKPGQVIYYVNGDCTKWSAAETMECFRSFLYGFKNLFPSELFEFLMHVLKSWQNKEIQIPSTILASTVFLEENGRFNYLKNSKAIIKSTQNFLQGMFNYYSSLKAVAASELTHAVWNKLHPDSELIFKHMEHSDDYCLIICTSSKEEFQEFRLLHKLVQKMCGMNDSVKKTNTQRFLMEFISLVSFNGQLTYPHIKKTKETGMNTSCTGYRDDMDMACSRISECVRVGVPLEGCYAMSRVHFSNVYRAYSMYKQVSTEEMFNIPVELFGIPDMHPLAFFLSKGNPNNFRLYHQSERISDKISINNKEIIERLFHLEITNNEISETGNQNTDIRFYFPKFRFDQENNLIKAMRKWCNFTKEESEKFFENNIEYNLVKPLCRVRLKDWLRSMYFKNNFAIAYSRTSRVQLHMRLSRFSTKKSLMPLWRRDREGEERFLSLSEYKSELMDILRSFSDTDVAKSLEECFFLKSLVQGDNSVEVFYDTLKYSTLESSNEHKIASTIDESPSKRVWISIENSIPTIIQYMFSPGNFMLDARPYKSLMSLSRDEEKILALYPGLKNADQTIVRNVYNDLKTNQQRNLTCMTYGRSNRRIEEFIKNQIEYGTTYRFKYKLSVKQNYSVTNPLTGELITRRLLHQNKDLVLSALEAASLVFALLICRAKIGWIRSKLVLESLWVLNEHGVRLKLLKDMINSVDYSMIQSYNAPIKHLKQFCFFRALLFEDKIPLSNFVKENTTYSYKYLKCDIPTQTEKIFFSYQQTDYIAYINEKQMITLVSPKRSFDTASSAYLIAKRLFNLISETELDLRLGIFDIRTNPEFELDIGLLKSDLFNVNQGIVKPQIMQMSGKSRLFYSKVDIEETTMPVFKGVIYFEENFNYNVDGTKKLLIIPEVDFENMSVTFNNLKLYTLPVLSSKQRISFETSESQYERLNVDGISLDFFLKNSMCEHYLLKSKKFYSENIDNVLTIDNKILGDSLVEETQAFFSKYYPIDFNAYSSEDSDREINREKMKRVFLAHQTSTVLSGKLMMDDKESLTAKIKCMNDYGVVDNDYILNRIMLLERKLCFEEGYTPEIEAFLNTKESVPVEPPKEPDLPTFDLNAEFEFKEKPGQEDFEPHVDLDLGNMDFSFDLEGNLAKTENSSSESASKQDDGKEGIADFDAGDFDLDMSGLDFDQNNVNEETSLKNNPLEETKEAEFDMDPDFSMGSIDLDMADTELDLGIDIGEIDVEIPQDLTDKSETMEERKREIYDGDADPLEFEFSLDMGLMDDFEVMPVEEFEEVHGEYGIETAMLSTDITLEGFKEITARNIMTMHDDSKASSFTKRHIENLVAPWKVLLHNYVDFIIRVHRPTTRDFVILLSIICRHVDRGKFRDTPGVYVTMKLMNEICPKLRDSLTQVSPGFFLQLEQGKFRLISKKDSFSSARFIQTKYKNIKITTYDEDSNTYGFEMPLDYMQEKMYIRKLRELRLEEEYAEELFSRIKGFLGIKEMTKIEEDIDDILFM